MGLFVGVLDPKAANQREMGVNVNLWAVVESPASHGVTSSVACILHFIVFVCMRG
jgi:hypothetical protein